MTNAVIKDFFDADSNTFSYVVSDPETRKCAVVDSVMDFDYASGTAAFESADEIVDYIREQGLSVEWILETHVHADHLSAAPYIKETLGGQLGIGAQIIRVQDIFGKVFNAGTEFERDGSQFDRLFVDGDTFSIGNLSVRVLHTPGHTPACMAYLIDEALAFVGDTLFMPDFGTARCDFPGGDARELFRSIQKLLSLPKETQLYMCHDYKTSDRQEFKNTTTVAEERQHNVHVHEGISEDEFVKMRTTRDAKLAMPRLLMPSVQVNMRAGKMPPSEENGQHYLKIPLTIKEA
ncbi:MBL fold metallo-hydrolase [Halomonas sp. LS-001]